jgi:hypothetical protein
MIFFKKKNRLQRQEIIAQWLALYPFRQIDYTQGEDNRIVMLIPHSQNWFTQKFLPKAKQPAQRIHLDEIGSFVWLHFDGKHTLKKISQLAEEKFSEKVQPVQERIVLFAQQMYKQKYITMYSRQFEEIIGLRK